MTTTPTGVAETTPAHDPSDGEAAFLAHFLSKDPDAAKPSDEAPTDEPRKKKPAVTEDTTDDAEPEETSEETPEGDEDEGDDEGKQRSYVDDDETYAKIKIGEEEHEVPVSKLKRLYGQEAALTQKSQAVAAKAKEVETQGGQYATGLQALLARATERAQPYANLDFLALSKTDISAEQLSALRDEARSRIEEVQFLQSELGNFQQAMQQRNHTALVEQAKQTVKTLADPASPMHIEGWNQTVYNDIRNFAINEGLSADIANNLVDAPAIKLLHMAMQFKKGQSKVVTTKVNKTVKKVVKTSKSMNAEQRSGKGAATAKAAARLKASGSVDDAADLFLARFKEAAED